MPTLATLAPLPTNYAPDYSTQEPYEVNPLQRLLADAMDAAGIPLEKRGSKAELSRRADVEDAIISNVFNRPRYVPDEDVRQRLATTLGISRTAIDQAAAEIKGLRVYGLSDQPRSMRLLDELSGDLALSATELSADERAAIKRRLDEIAAEFARTMTTDDDSE